MPLPRIRLSALWKSAVCAKIYNTPDRDVPHVPPKRAPLG